MATATIQVVVETSTYDVGASLAQFVSDVKAAVKNGGTVATAIAVGTAALADLVPQLTNISAAVGEAKADPSDEITTALLVGARIVNAIRS